MGMTSNKESKFYIGLVALIIVGNIFFEDSNNSGTKRRQPIFVEKSLPELQSADTQSSSENMGDNRGQNLGDSYIEGSSERVSSTGSAVSVDGRRYYMTARHVVNACDSVVVGPDPVDYRFSERDVKRVKTITEHPFADLALLELEKDSNSAGTETILGKAPQIDNIGVFVGYPQGKAAMVTARYMGYSQLRTLSKEEARTGYLSRRGGKRRQEQVDEWAEITRFPEIKGSLGGLSGGPAFHTDGTLAGIAIAENPRRGRVSTSQPAQMDDLIQFSALNSSAASNLVAFTPDTAIATAKYLRDIQTAAHVYCFAWSW